MEALETLGDGEQGVRDVGFGEYFEQFYDVISDDAPWQWRAWSVFTPDEVTALDVVLRLLDEACRSTPQAMTEDEFIASGWPERLRPGAERALDLMRGRGRFSEEVEERTPSPMPPPTRRQT